VVEAPGSYVPERGDAVWINLHPQAGHEQAGRRTGTGEEGWDNRDEGARDRDVLQPQGVCVINPASMGGTCGVVPWESCRSGRPINAPGSRKKASWLLGVRRRHVCPIPERSLRLLPLVPSEGPAHPLLSSPHAGARQLSGHRCGRCWWRRHAWLS
jgi:hypothetical protein